MVQFVTINNGVYNTYLGKSGLDVTIYPSTDSPARVYNDHIRGSNAKYICFIHSDVSCSGLENAIMRTIRLHPDFGALGAVGVFGGQRWGSPVREVITVDSCCLVINTDHGLWFDDVTFDSYHCYTEDMCMKVRALGLKNYTIDIPAFEYKDGLLLPKHHFVHHSHTMNKLGGSWGSYSKYRTLLSWKWVNVETT
jgi:hypothetical protein